MQQVLKSFPPYCDSSGQQAHYGRWHEPVRFQSRARDSKTLLMRIRKATATIHFQTHG
jgi:hypothetical protein